MSAFALLAAMAIAATTALGPIADRRAHLAQVHEEMPAWIDAELERRGWSWRQLERHELPVDLPELQWWIIHTDPVKFAECMLRERRLRGTPWRLHEWQKPPLRYKGNLLNRSGAAVGKTREIVARLAFLASTGGDALVAANLDGTMQEIFRELLWQIENSEWLAEQANVDGILKKPYPFVPWRTGGVINFRSVGTTGGSLRSLHPDRLLVGDEMAEWISDEIFDNFFSRAEPTCQVLGYSVPNGITDRKFTKLCRSARPWSERDQIDLAKGNRRDLPFVLVQWSQTQLPTWGPEAEERAIRVFGEKTSSNYRQQVLGEEGEPSASIFPWPRFRRCVRPDPGYVLLVLSRDDSSGRLELELLRGNPLWVPSEAGAETGATQPGVLSQLTERYELGNLEIEDLLQAYLPRLAATAPHLVAGGDFGSSPDPTDLQIWSVAGSLLELRLRVRLNGWLYPDVRQVIAALDRLLAPSYGWGFDATGVGSAVHQELVKAGFDPDRGSGYVWNSTRPSLDESGEPLTDGGKALTVSLKEAATRLLEGAQQRGDLGLPPDPQILSEWPNHRAEIGHNGRRQFGRTKDHTIDAARAAWLRWSDLCDGPAAAPVEYALVGRRRENAGLFDELGGGLGDFAAGGGLRGLV